MGRVTVGRVVVGLVVAAWCEVAPVMAQTRGLLPADYYKEVMVEEVAMRPQGDMVAFTVMTIVEKENRRHREIWLQPLASGHPADVVSTAVITGRFDVDVRVAQLTSAVARRPIDVGLSGAPLVEVFGLNDPGQSHRRAVEGGRRSSAAA